jgi:hypothetical protein
MAKRRLKDARLPVRLSPHSFRVRVRHLGDNLMRSPRPKSRLVLVFFTLWLCFPLTVEAAKLHVIIATDRTQRGIGPDMKISRDEFLAAVVCNTPAHECIVWEINPKPQENEGEMPPIETTIHPFGQELSRKTMLGVHLLPRISNQIVC